jgi:serine/threonine-protein kinase
MADLDPSGFGRAAVERGLLTTAQLDCALEIQASLRRCGVQRDLADVLVGEGFVRREQLLDLSGAFPGQTPPTRMNEPTRLERDLRSLIPGCELVEKLGQGGMGEVYKARQLGLDRWVAVKIMRPALAEDPDFIRRFLLEARTAGRLRHENIVSALDCGAANGRYFMIMELIEGRPVSEILKERGRIPEREALEWTCQVADGLEYAWSHRIIHRDIKPQNLMLTREGVVKICDLGLCRSARLEASLTATGELNCTPTYASPEQARGERDLDIRSDIYSLGATLYQLVTGHPPFTGTSAGDLLVKHVTEPPVPPDRRDPGVSPGVSGLILRMLEKKRELRPSTPGALASRIRTLLSEGGPLPATLTRPPASLSRPPTRRAEGEGVPSRRRPVLTVLRVLGVGAGLYGTALLLLLAFRVSPSRSATPSAVEPPPVVKSAPEPPDELRAVSGAALKKALDFAREHPKDLAGQQSLLERAAFQYDGTPAGAQAAAELKRVLEALRASFASDLAELDGMTRDFNSREAFGDAISVLEAARGRRKDPQWTLAIDARIRQLREKVLKVSASLEEQAVQARDEGRLDEVKSLRARIAAWKVAGMLERFDAGLLRKAGADPGGKQDYIFPANQLAGAGTFAKSRLESGLEVWVSGGESPTPSAASGNYVEFQFDALAGKAYRCWVYIGGCCGESLGFAAQWTEGTAQDTRNPGRLLSLEPGGNLAQPLKPSFSDLRSTHSAHEGGKKPVQFGWVEVPLAKFSSPGRKQVRLLSISPGSAVVYACVSALRVAPPSISELQALRK